MSTETIQHKKNKKTYEELLEEALSIADKTLNIWVEPLCLSLRVEHPDWENADIQRRVVKDLGGKYEESSIRNYWPKWIKNPDRIKGGEAAQKLWAEKRQKALMEKTERG